jgi:hypothetical protein
MTKNDFIALCGQYLINPDIALENKKIEAALILRDDKEVENLLKKEF